MQSVAAIPGPGNLSDDPLFAVGPLGAAYLAQVQAGQFGHSPCVDAGSRPSLLDFRIPGVATRTTRTDEGPDGCGLDIGFHYPRSASPAAPDTDGDTLTDAYEGGIGSAADDADSDDDGIPDGAEARDCEGGLPPPDADGDTVPNVLDYDSDDDGLPFPRWRAPSQPKIAPRRG